MSLILPKTCAMGGSKIGLVGVIGVMLLNPDGTVHTARTVLGIYELFGGCYGKEIEFPDNWSGSILWDTGGGSPVYATEDYVEGMLDTIDENINAIKANQEIRNVTITDASPSSTEFETDLVETANNFWNRGAVIFTSGQNEGLIRKIQDYTGVAGKIKLRTGLPYVPQTGDTLSIIPLRCFRLNFDDVIKIAEDTRTEFEKAGTKLTDVHDEAFGKWILDPAAKTLTLYKADGVSILKIFDLTDTEDDVPAFIGRTPQ